MNLVTVQKHEKAKWKKIKERTLLWMTVQTPPFPPLCSSTSDILTSTDMSEEQLDCNGQTHVSEEQKNETDEDFKIY